MSNRQKQRLNYTLERMWSGEYKKKSGFIHKKK